MLGGLLGSLPIVGDIVGGIFGGGRGGSTSTPPPPPPPQPPKEKDYTPYILGGVGLFAVIIMAFTFKK